MHERGCEKVNVQDSYTQSLRAPVVSRDVQNISLESNDRICNWRQSTCCSKERNGFRHDSAQTWYKLSMGLLLPRPTRFLSTVGELFSGWESPLWTSDREKACISLSSDAGQSRLSPLTSVCKTRHPFLRFIATVLRWRYGREKNWTYLTADGLM